MCKTIRIEYGCERCGKIVTKKIKPALGMAFVGRYPKTFSKVNKRPLCAECKKAYDQNFVQFMNVRKPVAKGI